MGPVLSSAAPDSAGFFPTTRSRSVRAYRLSASSSFFQGSFAHHEKSGS